MQFKALKFDDAAVLRYMDKQTRGVLSKFGAFVRQAAKQSIRKRKGPSRPGQPPSSHTGLLKRLIFFGYDPHAQSVVVGPARLNQRGSGEAPSLNEYGGETTKKVFGRRTRAKYPERPFMRPAFEQEKKQLPELWRNSIR